jgi:hypothetical protein
MDWRGAGEIGARQKGERLVCLALYHRVARRVKARVRPIFVAIAARRCYNGARPVYFRADFAAPSR